MRCCDCEFRYRCDESEKVLTAFLSCDRRNKFLAEKKDSIDGGKEMVSSQTGLRKEYEIKALEEKRIKSREKWERRFEETEALIKSFGMSPDEKRRFIIELSKRIGVI